MHEESWSTVNSVRLTMCRYSRAVVGRAGSGLRAAKAELLFGPRITLLEGKATTTGNSSEDRGGDGQTRFRIRSSHKELILRK